MPDQWLVGVRKCPWPCLSCSVAPLPRNRCRVVSSRLVRLAIGELLLAGPLWLVEQPGSSLVAGALAGDPQVGNARQQRFQEFREELDFRFPVLEHGVYS